MKPAAATGRTNNGSHEASRPQSYIPRLPWNEAGGSDEDFANYSGLTAAEQDCVYASLGYWVQDIAWRVCGLAQAGPSAYYPATTVADRIGRTEYATHPSGRQLD